MISNFYLLNRSFKFPEGIAIKELEEKIFNLSDNYSFMKDNSEKIFVHESIYDEEIYPDLSLCDFLYNMTVKTELSRDVKIYLSKIIDHSSRTDKEIVEIIDLLERHNEESIYGLLCLHEIDDIDDKYLVYSRHDWFEFHRYFLGLYPVSEIHFYNEAQKYFQNIYFHNRIVDSLNSIDGGIKNFSKTIIYSLSKLDSVFVHLYQDAKSLGSVNIVDILNIFSIKCGIETTLEGDLRRKNDLTFDFVYNDQYGIKCSEKVCCDPHLKLSKSDNSPGDSNFYFNRIYFHPGKDYLYECRVLIGHIGRHL